MRLQETRELSLDSVPNAVTITWRKSVQHKLFDAKFHRISAR